MGRDGRPSCWERHGHWALVWAPYVRTCRTVFFLCFSMSFLLFPYVSVCNTCTAFGCAHAGGTRWRHPGGPFLMFPYVSLCCLMCPYVTPALLLDVRTQVGPGGRGRGPGVQAAAAGAQQRRPAVAAQQRRQHCQAVKPRWLRATLGGLRLSANGRLEAVTAPSETGG
jgi:hypothetical protein